MTIDDCNPRGIPRPTAGELVLRRRLRALREILEDRDNPYHRQLVAMTDMLIDTEDDPPPARRATADDGVGRKIDLLGAALPRGRK